MLKNKRILAIVMAMMMVFSVLPGLAFADTAYNSNYLKVDQSTLVDYPTSYTSDVNSRYQMGPNGQALKLVNGNNWGIKVDPQYNSASTGYRNYILNQIDATGSVTFTYNLSGDQCSGVSKDNILEQTISNIYVCKASDKDFSNKVASYENKKITCSDVKTGTGFTGSNSKYLGYDLDVYVDGLEAGEEYALVFDEGVAGKPKNGVGKYQTTLGCKVVFYFATASVTLSTKVKTVEFSYPESGKNLTYTASSISSSAGMITYTTENGSDKATIDEVNELFDISSSNQSIVSNEDIQIKASSNTSGKKRFYFTVAKNQIKGTGTVDITVKSKEDDSIKAVKTFTIKDGLIKDTFLYASPGQTVSVKYTLNDTANDPSKVKWTIDSENVASIDGIAVDGNSSVVTLKAIANGECTVTATFGEWFTTCKFTVLKDGVYANTNTGSVSPNTAGEPLTELVLEGVGTETGHLGLYENGKKVSSVWTYSDNENVVADDGGFASQFVAVADGTANIYFYNYDTGNVLKILPVTVRNTGKTAETGWTENPDDTKVQSVIGGTVSLTNHSVRSNISNKAINENFIVEELATDAEFNFTITPDGKAGGGKGFPDNIEQILADNCESYQASIQDYVKLVDEKGNSVDATVTVEKIYVNGQQISADIKVSSEALQNSSKYNLVLKWGLPTISYNVYMNKVDTGLLKSNIKYMFNTVKKDFSKMTVSEIADQGYTGTAITPVVEVKDGDDVLVMDKDYTVKYENNTEIGTATVTITGIGAYDGKITKTFNIVKVAVKGIKVNKTNITLDEGKTAVVKASVEPETATDASVTWTSSNDKVAKVDANGKITAISAGTATITVIANNGNDVKAACKVNVKPVFTKLTAKAASNGYNSVKVTWAKDKKADGYTVYRYNAKTKKYVAVKSTTACSYTNTKLTTGKAYTYKVKAYRVVNGKKVYGSYSTKASAKPIPATMNMTVKAKKGGRVAIQWDKVAGTTKYVVYKSTKKNSGYYKERITTQTKYTDTGLKKGKTYYYKARAYKVVDGKKVYGKYTKVFAVKAK